MPMRPPMSATALVLMAAGAGLGVDGVPDGINETAIDAAVTFGELRRYEADILAATRQHEEVRDTCSARSGGRSIRTGG